MAFTSADLLTNAAGDYIPQYLDPSDTTQSPEGTFKPLVGDGKNISDAQVQALLDTLNNKIDSIIDGTTPATTTLSGRNVENIVFIQPVAVIDTSPIDSGLIDTSKYKKILFLATTSLNQSVDIHLSYTDFATYTYQSGAWTYYGFGARKATLAASDGTTQATYELNSYFPELNDKAFEEIKFRTKCGIAPTAGQITVEAWGVPN